MLAQGYAQAKQVLLQVLKQPLEPILHPSVWRLRWIGTFTLLGHPIFWWVWSQWLPQPWESEILRALSALLSLVFLMGFMPKNLHTWQAGLIFNIIGWLQLPLFFSWMLLCNQSNQVWLPSFCAMVLIYYHVVDWRLATVGLFLGAIAAEMIFKLLLNLNINNFENYTLTTENLAVIVFAWLTGLVLGFSSANRRTEHLKDTLTTMGVLAHELRTPVASIGLISGTLINVINHFTSVNGSQIYADKLKSLAEKLGMLVQVMTTHINTQISSARQNLPAAEFKKINLSDCIQETINSYPFGHISVEQCVILKIDDNFCIHGVSSWLMQMLNNLIKNALFALAAKQCLPVEGDLVIELKKTDRLGLILITDRGIGMSEVTQKKVFEPFYSTNHAMGHGLGLAYCKRITAAFDGQMSVQSEFGVGTTFTLSFPLAI